MGQTEQSAASTEQIAIAGELAATGSDQVTDNVSEKSRGGMKRGLIEGLKIIVGMLVFIGLAIYSQSHHPHLPVRH
jgi:hypothetical protein